MCRSSLDRFRCQAICNHSNMYYKLCLKIETLNVGIPKAHCVHEINVSRARKDECLELLL